MAVMFSLVYECAMTGLSKSDRGEPGGLPGGGAGFIWAFRTLVVFSIGELSQEDRNRELVF